MSTKSIVEEIHIDAENAGQELPEKEDDVKCCTLKNSALLAAWIIVVEVIGMALGIGLPPGTWANSLVQSPGTPPTVLFPILWPIFFLSLAVVGWFLSLKISDRQVLYVLIAHCLQLIISYVWIPVYQYYQRAVAALVILCVMVVITGAIMVRIWLLKMSILRVKSQIIALIMVPYFIWLCYATHLNAYIVAANPSRI